MQDTEIVAWLKSLKQGQDEIIRRLDQMEKHREQETYSTEEAAKRLNRAAWTVRDWCNRGRAKGLKVRGKGRTGEWRIPHAELVRLQNEGPLPEAG